MKLIIIYSSNLTLQTITFFIKFVKWYVFIIGVKKMFHIEKIKNIMFA